MSIVRAAWLTLVLVPPAAAQAPSADSTLANGLQVIVTEDHRLPRAVLVVAVRTGAVTQEPAQDGLSHLYEHLLFRGYPHGGLTGFEKDASRIDGAWDAQTTEDMVEYFLEVPPDKVPQGLTLLATLVSAAKFSQKDLDSERPVVLDELARNMSTPEAQLGRQVDQVLWGDAWSREDIGGDSASVTGVTLAMLQENYRRYYVPNNAALIVSGDVSPAAVRAAAASAFAGWTVGPDPFLAHPIPPFPVLARSRIMLVATNQPDVVIVIGLRAPPARDSADAAAVQVLCDAMDGGSLFAGHLVPQLLQTFNCVYDAHRESARLLLVGHTTPERTVSAFLALLNELRAVGDSGAVDTADLAVGTRYRLVEDAVAAQYAGRRAYALADDWAGPGLALARSERARLDAVRPADVQRAAQTWIVQATHVIGILAPASTLTALRQRLSGGSP